MGVLVGRHIYIYIYYLNDHTASDKEVVYVWGDPSDLTSDSHRIHIGFAWDSVMFKEHHGEAEAGG